MAVLKRPKTLPLPQAPNPCSSVSPRLSASVVVCLTFLVRIMMVLTATHVVEERGPQTYGATPLTQILLDPGWADGLRHLYSHTF